jgi:hypothetical protein
MVYIWLHGKGDMWRSPVDLGVAWVDQMVTVPCEDRR